MKSFFSSFLRGTLEFCKDIGALVATHKIMTLIALVVLGTGAYFGYDFFLKGSDTQYVFSTVQKETVVSTVSGSGQISAENQIALTAKTSGEITSINVIAGQEIKKGQHIASIDLGTSGFELESARLSYEKVAAAYPSEIADATTDAENANVQARTELVTASSDITTILDTTHDVINGYLHFDSSVTKSQTAETYITTANKSYAAANTAVKTFKTQYQLLGDSTDATQIATTFASARTATLAVLQAAKDARDAVSYTKDRSYGNATEASSAYVSMNTAVSDASETVSSLASSLSALQSANQTVATYASGSGALDVRSAQLALAEKQDAYNDHFVVAPFDGVIAKVSAKTGDSVSSGGAIATIITKEQLAEITMNEVEVSKVKAGQKAILTFDAIDSLSLAGTVAEVDGIGTVSQGVVSYTVKIGLDTQSDQVKPGMTVNVDIQTATAENVLSVPASAVKTTNGKSYVEVVDSSADASEITTKKVMVITGISSDTSTEILSGLSEGDEIVVRTTTTSSTTKSTAASATTRTGGIGIGSEPKF